jgi:DNA-binding transcriptional regulator YhcF (GntR family)
VTYHVDPHSCVPPSRQLVEALLDDIARRELGAGDRLPSVRTLAADALVNPNTVCKAYRDLESAGVVQGQNGRGVFVTAEGPKRACALRQRATLDAVRAAIAEALRAGHSPSAMADVVDELLGKQEVVK